MCTLLKVFSFSDNDASCSIIEVTNMFLLLLVVALT